MAAMGQDEPFERVRTLRTARDAVLKVLVDVLRAHKEVLLYAGALHVEWVWGHGWQGAQRGSAARAKNSLAHGGPWRPRQDVCLALFSTPPQRIVWALLGVLSATIIPTRAGEEALSGALALPLYPFWGPF